MSTVSREDVVSEFGSNKGSINEDSEDKKMTMKTWKLIPRTKARVSWNMTAVIMGRSPCNRKISGAVTGKGGI